MEPDICISTERIFERYESYAVEHNMKMKVERSYESITLLHTLWLILAVVGARGTITVERNYDR